jgi:hypothetical protein
MDRPAAEERMAVFEIRLLPGSASIRDCAFVFGSVAGTLEALRVLMTELIAGSVRAEIVGRSRAAPVFDD